MSQSAYYFDGVSYTSAVFKTFSLFGAYVIPGYLENLVIAPSANPGKVIVNTGAAVIGGSTTSSTGGLYLNDADLELTLESAVNNRVDTIFIDISVTPIRATVLKGVEAANPVAATIEVADVPLAHIYIPAGFNPAADVIPAYHVRDTRIFRSNGSVGFDTSYINLMPNSEFCAFSGAAAGAPPEYWRTIGGAPTISKGSLQFPAIRGNGVRIQGGVGLGIQTQIRVPPGVYTIQGILNITTGPVIVTVDGTTTQRYYHTGSSDTFRLRHTEAGNEITISITSNNAAGDFVIGQFMIFQGYEAGAFLPKNELIMLDYAVTDANWTATAKSTGYTTISLSTAFGPMYTTSTPIRGLILTMRARDSGSAAGTPNLRLHAPGGTLESEALSRLNLAGVANDDWRQIVGYVGLNGANQFSVGVSASGAATLDATLEIIGIVT